MLILATVSIALVMNSGIIDRADESVKTYSAEEITEQLKLAYSEFQMSQYTGTPMTTQDIQAKLGQIFGTENVKDVSLANGKLTATINGKPYEYNTATGTAGEKKPGIGDLVTKDNYGDYIDLGQSIEEIGTSSSADDWRILYNDKAGHVYAILADYLPNTNPAVTASGLTTSNVYNVYSTSRDDLLTKLNNTDVWKSLISTSLQNKGAIVNGAVTEDIIKASYKGKYNVDLSLYFYIDNDSSKGIDTLYMPHPSKPEESDYNNCRGYWLASLDNSNTYSSKLVIRYGCLGNGIVSNDMYNSKNIGLCPVVSLPSNLQVTNNNGVWSLANN